MALTPELVTPRLVLRPPQAADFAAWAAFSADAGTTVHLGGPQPRPVSWRAFCLMAGAWALYGFGMFSVLQRDTGRWIGRVGPWRPEGWPGNEIGWGLHQDVWGRGLALEAAGAAIDWALDTLGWDEFIHCIDPANTRSIALATRLGSSRRGSVTLPAPVGHEVDVYGQSAAAWRAAAPQRRGGLPR